MDETKRDGRSFRRIQKRRIKCPLCWFKTVWTLVSGMRAIAGKCQGCGSILGYQFTMRDQTPGPISKRIVYQISELGAKKFRARGRCFAGELDPGGEFEKQDLSQLYE